MKRLRRKMKERGIRGLAHGNRGKKPWNKTASEKIEKVIKLARGRYQGLNDTHLTEKLKEKEKISVSRPTVREILRRAGIAAVRKRGVKRHYKRRERKAQEGALLLWDGSPHRWFGDKHGEWTLMAVIDDATGKLLCGVFALEEDAQSYLICLKQMLLEKGIPLAIYMDRHGIFRRNDEHWTVEEELAGEQTPTQVGQALRALGVEPIFALSPQAKGRVERLFNTLQDRLVQELRLAGITTPKQATVFVNGPFKTDFNTRFAKPARESQAAWRPLPKGLDVDRICSFRYEATVGNDNAVRLGGMILDIPAGPHRRGYAKARVEVRQLIDGRWRVYYQNQLLLETTPPVVQAPLRTSRRRYRTAQSGEKRRMRKLIEEKTSVFRV
jgi:transposase